MLDPTQPHHLHQPVTAPERIVVPEEQAIDWGDGTVWFISWLSDFDGYSAERWYDPDEDAATELRDCPGPEDGVFASLDALEAAMGEALPDDVRSRLQREAAAYPCHEREAWGVIFAAEVTHLLDDGTLVTTWAPAWAEDPLDPKWDLDCCGSPPHMHARHVPGVRGA